MDNVQSDMKELGAIITGIASKLTKLPNTSGNQKRILQEDTERDLDDAQRMLRILNRNVKDLVGLSQTERSELRGALSRYESEVAEQWKKFSALTTSGYAIAPTSTDDEFNMLSDRQREKIMETQRKLDNQNERLDNTYAIAVSSEEIGTSVLSRLNDQRATLLHARDGVSAVDDGLTTASRTLTDMRRRAFTDTVTQVVICICLGLTIIGIIFFKWLLPMIK